MTTIPLTRDDAAAQARSLVERACAVYPGPLLEIARALGVAPDTLGQYLSGRRRPSPARLQQLATLIAQAPDSAALVGEIRDFAGQAAATRILVKRKPSPEEVERKKLLVPAARAHPGHTRAVECLLRGVAALESGEWKSAATEIGGAIGAAGYLEPVGRGAALAAAYGAGDDAEVLRSTERILYQHRGPDLLVLDVLYWDGRAAERLGDRARAVNAMARIIAVVPGYPDAYPRWAMLVGYAGPVPETSQVLPGNSETGDGGGRMADSAPQPATVISDAAEGAIEHPEYQEYQERVAAAEAAGTPYTDQSRLAAFSAIPKGNPNWRKLLY